MLKSLNGSEASGLPGRPSPGVCETFKAPTSTLSHYLGVTSWKNQLGVRHPSLKKYSQPETLNAKSICALKDTLYPTQRKVNTGLESSNGRVQ